MEGSKLKNIVIVILVLLNLFLLLLSGGRRMQDSRSREEARLAAIEVILADGVELQPENVPQEMLLRSLSARRDMKTEKLQARALLGGEVQVEAKGGDVYRYENTCGWLQVHSTGQYSAQLTPGMTPLGQERPEDHAVALLSRLDVQSQVVSNSVSDGQGEVVLSQSLDGVKLLDCQTTIRYENGAAVAISGGRKLPGRAEREAGTPISVATALMRLYNGLNDMGDVYNAIRSIEPAYLLGTEGAGVVRLTPVWQVETDTGTYRLDTLTGMLSRTGEHGRQVVQELSE